MPEFTITNDDKRRLDALRARARRAGIGIHKARGGLHANNHGGLMVYDLARNAVIDGDRFDLSLEETEQRIADLIATA